MINKIKYFSLFFRRYKIIIFLDYAGYFATYVPVHFKHLLIFKKIFCFLTNLRPIFD